MRSALRVRMMALRTVRHPGLIVGCVALLACAPTVELPPAPIPPALLRSSRDPAILLARAMAPVLYVQRDEPFALDRVAVVVHPARPIIAYHLLWRHDINGQWLPWAKPSDEEVVWVGYDSLTLAPHDLWTYWHGTILHTPWRTGAQPAVDVQWGKHGSLPHDVIESDLPRTKTLNVFYALAYILIPDIWLGRLSHGGPAGFFHSYARYRDFSIVMDLRDRLDAVFRTDDASSALRTVFGPRYAHKMAWPLAATRLPQVQSLHRATARDTIPDHLVQNDPFGQDDQ